MADSEGGAGSVDGGLGRGSLIDFCEQRALVSGERIGDGVDGDAHLERQRPAGHVIGQVDGLGSAVGEGVGILLAFEELLGKRSERLVHGDDPGTGGIGDAVRLEALFRGVDIEAVVDHLLREQSGFGRVGLL